MTTNFGKNQEVANTLDTYLQQDKPRFSILLQGKWGSGKTWFIRNYIDSKKDKKYKCCYVSLFDIEHLKEIDSQILAYCNPILSKAEGAGRFAGGIIERCIPLIKDTDVKDLGKLLTKFCKIPKNLVLVLDDLERTLIPMELVLGYVSNMLDEVGIKVILLCDQEQIPKERKEIFLRFKEKVVGSSIAIEPDVQTVFNYQVNSIFNDKVKKAFLDNKEALINDFNSSESNNLRNIKRIIYEFSLCYNQMNKEMQEDILYISEFLHMLFIFSIEIHKGLPRHEYCAKIEKICTYYKFPNRYGNIDEVPHRHNWHPPIPPTFLEKFFYEGLVDVDTLTTSYSHSLYANSSKLPLLIYRKFNKMNLDEAEARNLYRQLIQDLDELKYTDAREILHAYDIMLKFSEIGIEPRPAEDIIKFAKKYIDSIEINDNSFEMNKSEKLTSFLTANYPQFDTLYDYICKRILDINNSKMNTFIRETSLLLPDKPHEFLERLPINPEMHVILTSLDTKDLVSRLTLLRLPILNKVMETIYYYLEIRDNSREDITWLQDFCSTLEDSLALMPLLDRHILQNFIGLFRQLIPTGRHR